MGHKPLSARARASYLQSQEDEEEEEAKEETSKQNLTVRKRPAADSYLKDS